MVSRSIVELLMEPVFRAPEKVVHDHYVLIVVVAERTHGLNICNGPMVERLQWQTITYMTNGRACETYGNCCPPTVRFPVQSTGKTKQPRPFHSQVPVSLVVLILTSRIGAFQGTVRILRVSNLAGPVTECLTSAVPCGILDFGLVVRDQLLGAVSALLPQSHYSPAPTQGR